MSRITFALLLSLAMPCALAYDFALNPIEFKAWPQPCQAKYVITTGANAGDYRTLVPDAVIERWKTALDDKTWTHMHHGCAGMVWVERAERLRRQSEVDFKYALSQAKGELSYSLKRLPRTDLYMYKFRIAMARVDYLSARTQPAYDEMRRVLAAAPELPDSYSALSMYLFRDKNYSAAREVLEKGLKSLKQPPAEIHYFLGLVLARQKDYEAARVQAKEAYRRGYPLPGLRNQLKAAGHWDT